MICYHKLFQVLGKIHLKNIRIYAFHGCLWEESQIGSDYRVDLEIKANLKKATQSDDLKDTVDYVHLQSIVRREMEIRSNLLEHVAERIISSVFNELPEVKKVVVSVAKLNPPIGGDVAEVSVILKRKR